MEPPTLRAALLCSSWEGTDMWLYLELITLCIAHSDGVTTKVMRIDFPNCDLGIGNGRLEIDKC